jgi:hypothetical protein
MGIFVITELSTGSHINFGFNEYIKEHRAHVCLKCHKYG